MLYSFFGTVVSGKKRGRLLGFPTANILLTTQIPEGTYVSEVTFDNKTYQAAAFIGSAKTFGEKYYKAEVYILDFSGEIYDKELTVSLHKLLRNNLTFTTEEALITQMEQDVIDVRVYFEKR